ncbi:MAG: hypothetical protein IKD69_12590 [Solobacterium sp.]|nr:hypothetical protein [Solobacterium sp.]
MKNTGKQKRKKRSAEDIMFIIFIGVSLLFIGYICTILNGMFSRTNVPEMAVRSSSETIVRSFYEYPYWMIYLDEESSFRAAGIDAEEENFFLLNGHSIEADSPASFAIYRLDENNEWEFTGETVDNLDDVSVFIAAGMDVRTADDEVIPGYASYQDFRYEQDDGSHNIECTLRVKTDSNYLPLRDQPLRYASEIVIQIPDGETVPVDKYVVVEDEVWLHCHYQQKAGWVRGGMLTGYAAVLEHVDLWKNKFLEKYPLVYQYLGKASITDTIYYQPDLSSGVEDRLTGRVLAEVYAQEGEWYYVEYTVNQSDELHTGWINEEDIVFTQEETEE